MLSWLAEAPEGQLGLTKLARRMGISTSRLSHLVDRTREHGWVVRVPDPLITPVRLRVLSWFFFGSGSGGRWLGGVCASGTSSVRAVVGPGGVWGGAGECPVGAGSLPR
ncbi:MarR family transcriptional regulator [Streptomyces sp. NPDC052109]|uniref:MarR family transcriptional regulator n=1 Tax=Streptomyces sp. NPDC052109 TaxID=3155527 RepID=UPI00343A3274